MENLVGSIFSGFAQVVGKLFGHPLDFLSGKSCDKVCQPTWDFTCYIENFCIAHLVKSTMVFVLFYFVLLFLYLLYKLGICHCISHIIFGTIRGCFASCFNVVYCCCTFFCFKLQKHNKQRRRRRKRDTDIEESVFSSDEDGEEGSFPFKEHRKRRSSSLSRRKDYKGEHLRKSLRARNHRINVGISSDQKKKRNTKDDVIPIDHHIRVAKTSKFAQKGPHYKGSMKRRQKVFNNSPDETRISACY